jgi:hypothetical protein
LSITTDLLNTPEAVLSIINVPSVPIFISTLLTVLSTCASNTTDSHIFISQAGVALKDLRNQSVTGGIKEKGIISDSHNIFHSILAVLTCNVCSPDSISVTNIEKLPISSVSPSRDNFLLSIKNWSGVFLIVVLPMILSADHWILLSLSGSKICTSLAMVLVSETDHTVSARVPAIEVRTESYALIVC